LQSNYSHRAAVDCACSKQAGCKQPKAPGVPFGIADGTSAFAAVCIIAAGIVMNSVGWGFVGHVFVGAVAGLAIAPA
jgi:hypothetical protein